MWPDLIEEGDAVFLRAARQADPETSLGKFTDLVDAECFFNHVHLLDEFENDATLREEPFWARMHDDFRRATSLAGSLAEIWAARLSAQFPEGEFAVYATRDDNPVVRFHKVRPGCPPWCKPEDIKELGDGAALLIRVGGGKIVERLGTLTPPSPHSDR